MASNRVEQIAAHLNYPQGMLNGQVAIITGSGQGIGAECARLFAKVRVADIEAGKRRAQMYEDGWKLMIPVAKARATAEEITKSGGQALAVPGDLLSDSYIDELVKKSAEFGNGKIQ